MLLDYVDVYITCLSNKLLKLTLHKEIILEGFEALLLSYSIKFLIIAQKS